MLRKDGGKKESRDPEVGGAEGSRAGVVSFRELSMMLKNTGWLIVGHTTE